MYWPYLLLTVVYLLVGIPTLIEEICWALHNPYREPPDAKNGPEPVLPGFWYRLLVWPVAFLLILALWPIFHSRQQCR